MKILLLLILIGLITLKSSYADDNELFTPMSGDIEGYASIGDNEASTYGLGVLESVITMVEVFLVLTTGSWIIYKENEGEPWL